MLPQTPFSAYQHIHLWQMAILLSAVLPKLFFLTVKKKILLFVGKFGPLQKNKLMGKKITPMKFLLFMLQACELICIIANIKPIILIWSELLQ